MEGGAPGRADPGRGGETVGDVLVHAGGRREDAAAHVGNTAGLERALNGAILAALSVQDREGHIDIELVEGLVDELHEPALGLLTATRDEHDGAHIVGLPGTGHDIGGIAGVVEPGAVAIDADHDGREAVGGKAGDDIAGRLQRDVMLGRYTAEDDRDVQHGSALLDAHELDVEVEVLAGELVVRIQSDTRGGIDADDGHGHGVTAGAGKVELVTGVDVLDVGNLLGRVGEDEVVPTLAVGFGGGDVDGLLLPHLHIADRGIEAGDHLMGAAGERDGLTSVVGAVELGTVIQRAAVVGAHLLAVV